MRATTKGFNILIDRSRSSSSQEKPAFLTASETKKIAVLLQQVLQPCLVDIAVTEGNERKGLKFWRALCCSLQADERQENLMLC